MECIRKITTSAQITDLHWSRLSEDIISLHGCSPNNIKIWNKSGAMVSVLDGHQGRVLAGCLNESGEILYTVGGEGTLRLWKIYNKSKSIDEKCEEPMKMLIR